KDMGAHDLFSKFGTPGVFDGNVLCGDAGIKNWKGVGPVDFPSYAKIGVDAVMAEQEKKYFCWQCTLGCGGEMKAKEGRAKFSHKPEYETMACAGSMCLNDDLETVIRVNDLVNAYGLDSISAPVSVAFAMELFEKGIITLADTDGVDLRWGNGEAVVEMVRKIALREGFGAMLADGVKKAAERIGKGADIYAMHVNGQEIPMHDPRFLPGLQMAYQMDATPARHTQGSELAGAPDFGHAPYDKYAYGTTGKVHSQFSHTMHFVNAAGLCMFGYLSYPIQSMIDFSNAICGWDITRADVEVIGERIANVRHAFNLREGLNPLNVVVPPRLLGNPPLQQGNTRGVTVDAAKNNADYLRAMQWDQETAMPNPARLTELGMPEVAQALGL
ncbi:MAG: aldehyde ferredoxin oxidoreductase C-terminal domain-containing protein, partial [Chloroflexota bacterium]